MSELSPETINETIELVQILSSQYFILGEKCLWIMILIYCFFLLLYLVIHFERNFYSFELSFCGTQKLASKNTGNKNNERDRKHINKLYVIQSRHTINVDNSKGNQYMITCKMLKSILMIKIRKIQNGNYIWYRLNFDVSIELN